MPNTFIPADGEGLISKSAKRLMTEALAEIPASKKGAFLTVVEQHNSKTVISVAAAVRVGHDWEVATWLRTDVKDHLDGGVSVKKMW